MKKKLSALWVASLVFMVNFSIVGQPILVQPSSYFDSTTCKQFLETSATDAYNIQIESGSFSISNFEKQYSDFSLNQGIVLSTGNAFHVTGPNGSPFTSLVTYGPSVPILENMASGTTTDGAVVEFDIMSCDSLYSLWLVFGSEEYMEYVGSSNTDVFGVFVDGPNPNGSYYTAQNFAFIPGTNTHINSSTINTNSWSNLFISNGTGTTPSNEALEFDGYTVALPIDIPIVPGEQYHITIAIVDVGDPNIDSGIFFCAKDDNSSIGFTVSLESPYGWGNQLYEGKPAWLRFEKSNTSDLGFPVVAYLDIAPQSTATLGVDISMLPDSVVIPAGTMVYDLPITVYDDSIYDTAETLYLHFGSECPAGGYDLDLTVNENYFFSAGITPNYHSSCDGGPLVIHTWANAADSMLSFFWSDGSTADSLYLSGTSAVNGYYYVTITHANGSVETDGLYVSLSVPLVLQLNNNSDNCAFGAIDLDVTNGNPNHYVWSNGASTQDIEHLLSGTYSVTVYDANGCSQVASTTIYAPGPLDLEILSTTNCDTSLGILMAGVGNGGTPPFSYNWSNSTTDLVMVSVPAGDYSLTVTDVLGCTYTDTLLDFNPSPITIDLSYSTAGCVPSSAEVLVEGGNMPYSISWSNGDVGPRTLLQQAGTYAITVQDTIGCTTVDSIELVYNPNVSVEINDSVHIDPCSITPGAVDIYILNVAPPVSFNWSNGESSVNVSNLLPGNYSLTISDANYCYSVFDYQIPEFQHPTLDYTLSTNPVFDCALLNDGMAEVAAISQVSDISYQWSNGSSQSILQNLSPDTYFLTVSDLCYSFEDTVEIAYQFSISPAFNITGSQCYGSVGRIFPEIDFPARLDSIYLVDLSTGIAHYRDSVGYFSSLSDGDFEVVLIDTFGCTFTDTLNVPLVFSSPHHLYPTSAYCADSTGSIYVSTSSLYFDNMYLSNINTGINYFPDDARNYELLPAGTYVNYITDIFGCTVSDTTTIDYHPSLMSMSATEAFCEDYPVEARVQLQAPSFSPHFAHYELDFPSFSYMNVTSGTSVSASYTDDASYGPFPIGFDFQFFGETHSHFNVCTNGFIDFQTYLSNGTSPTYAIPSGHAAVPKKAIFGLYRDWDLSNAGDIKYQTMGTAPTRYLMVKFMSVPLFNYPSILGSFQIILYEGSNTVEIKILSGPTNTGPYANKGIIGIHNEYGTVAYVAPGYNLTPFDIYNYAVRFVPQVPHWYNPMGDIIAIGDSVSFAAVQEGTYLCEAYTYCGLETDSFSIEFPSNVVDLGPDQVLCPQETIVLQATDTLDLLWSTGEQTPSISIENEGYYWVQASLNNGLCEWYDGVAVSREEMNYFDGLDASICTGETLVVTLDTNFVYQWENGSSQNWVEVTDTVSYSLTVSNSNCTIIDTLSLEPVLLPVPLSSLIDDTTKCPNLPLLLDGGNEPLYQYAWSTGDNIHIAQIDAVGTHYLTITDPNGCFTIDSVEVGIQPYAEAGFDFYEAFGTVQFVNTSSNAYSYVWDFGDWSALDYSQNPVHLYPSYTQNAWYTPTLVAQNQCGADTVSANILIFDIDEQSADGQLQIFPNPNNGHFILSGSLGGSEEITLRVYNSTGQGIFEKPLSSLKDIDEEIDLGQIAPGVYFLKAESKNESKAWKMLVR